jgi:membrane protein
VVKIIVKAQQLTGAVNARWQASVGRARRNSSIFDHLWRTKERYGEVLGARLAAAISYYGFFAVFALGMVAYSVALRVFAGSDQLINKVDEFLESYFASLQFDELKASGTTIATVGLISLVFAGIGWVDALRSSQRAVWKLDQHPGNFLVLRVTDLGLLILVGMLMAISLTVIDGLQSLFDAISDGKRSIYLTTATIGLTVLVNMVIGVIMMTVLPRIHMSPRRLFFPVLTVGAGLTLLTSIGRAYAGRTENNPAYVLVASSVGLLIYLYLFNQILLWSTALAATSTRGRALDLAWGKPRAFGPDGETLENGNGARLDLTSDAPDKPNPYQPTPDKPTSDQPAAPARMSDQTGNANVRPSGQASKATGDQNDGDQDDPQARTAGEQGGGPVTPGGGQDGRGGNGRPGRQPSDMNGQNAEKTATPHRRKAGQ